MSIISALEVCDLSHEPSREATNSANRSQLSEGFGLPTGAPAWLVHPNHQASASLLSLGGSGAMPREFSSYIHTLRIQRPSASA